VLSGGDTGYRLAEVEISLILAEINALRYYF